MSREIKFRGKTEDGKWVYGYYMVEETPSGNRHIICCEKNGLLYFPSVDPKTVGQFTGLRDSKGVDIFEGDILAPIVVGKKNRYIVRWYKEGASFHVRPVNQDEGGYSLYVNSHGYSPHDVVGNIHEGE